MKGVIIKPVYIFGSLCTAFLLFTLFIYTKPKTVKNKELASGNAIEGRLIWQKYNCQSCHQLYGLGGYLGPDLTNIYSKYQGDSIVFHSFLTNGIKQMPRFRMNKEEERMLFEFLKYTDKSGISDPRVFSVKPDGMIEEYEKK